MMLSRLDPEAGAGMFEIVELAPQGLLGGIGLGWRLVLEVKEATSFEHLEVRPSARPLKLLSVDRAAIVFQSGERIHVTTLRRPAIHLGARVGAEEAKAKGWLRLELHRRLQRVLDAAWAAAR